MELENLEDPPSYDKQHQIFPFRHDWERLNITRNLDLYDLELHILCGIEQPAVLASVLWFKARDMSERKMPASAVFTIASVRLTLTLFFSFFFSKTAVHSDTDLPYSPHPTWFICPFCVLNCIRPKRPLCEHNTYFARWLHLFAICRHLSFAFLLYHSSLQGMKMSDKWHHCHVWISFSLPGPLIW